MKKKLMVLSGFVLSSTPFIAFAQTTGGTPTVCTGGQITTLQSLLCKLNELLGAVLPFMIALGVVFFVWGVITYVVGGDEEAKAKGRSRIIYGIIGLAVIVGLWGLVRIVTNTFGLNNVTNITLPTVPY
ncbi:MAG TPA: pilin [Candidatus Paceibacterota bacterium]